LIFFSLNFLSFSFGVIIRLKVYEYKHWNTKLSRIRAVKRIKTAKNRRLTPNRKAQMARAIVARNWMNAMITMKQVIVF